MCACLVSCVGFTVGMIRLDAALTPQVPIEALPSDTPLSAGVCLVSPLEEVRDREALKFEGRAGSPDVVDRRRLTPATSRALARFERVVKSIGGVFSLQSGYRPKGYQAHLRDVWDKWMLTMRNNVEPQCDALRAQVQMEFQRHGLLETQRPAPLSDHTLGIGFDASVFVPAGARLKRRRVTVDLLARLSGFKRPDVYRDPVHFRLVAGKRTYRG